MIPISPQRAELAMTTDVAPQGTEFDALSIRNGAVSIITMVLSTIRRRKWMILGAIGGSILLGILLTILMTPRFTASATLEIQRETGSFVNVQGVQQKDSAVDQEFYNTQYGLLQSQTLAERVATDLRLSESPDFFKSVSVKSDRWFDDAGRPLPAMRRARVKAAGSALLKSFSVSPLRLSRLVTISFTHPDPAMAKRVIDTWSADFVKLTLERRFEMTSYARQFLEGRIKQLRQRIDQGQRDLVYYASREGIINVPVASNSGGNNGSASVTERSLVAGNLTMLNDELNKAIAQRVETESRLNAPGGSVQEALQNGAISTLRQRRTELSADYARLMVQFEPNYPPAMAVRRQIEQLDVAITREENRVNSSLQQEYKAAARREQELRSQVAQLKNDFLDQRRRGVEYNIIQRDLDTNQQLYDALLQRYKEIGIAGGVGANNIVVVDPASLPQSPSSPNLLLNLLVATLLGVVIGGGLAFMLEQIDQGVSDPSEINTSFGIPLLGAIPKVDTNALEALGDRKSSLSEAYLSLQTNLAFSTSHGVPRSLAVTSSRPAEGKSTTANALARSLARSAGRVLLIDADMRSPSVHHQLGIENRRGLSNYLSGDDDVTSMIHDTAYPGMDVITAGPHPPSAPDLLTGSRLDRLISHLLESYQCVVFDIPPVMGLADAPLIGSRVEGIIFVIEAHSTQKAMAKVALQRLAAAQATIKGAVLTKFNSKRAHYGYGYDYGYGYGYGQEDKAPDA